MKKIAIGLTALVLMAGIAVAGPALMPTNRDWNVTLRPSEKTYLSTIPNFTRPSVTARCKGEICLVDIENEHIHSYDNKINTSQESVEEFIVRRLRDVITHYNESWEPDRIEIGEAVIR